MHEYSLRRKASAVGGRFGGRFASKEAMDVLWLFEGCSIEFRYVFDTFSIDCPSVGVGDGDGDDCS